MARQNVKNNRGNPAKTRAGVAKGIVNKAKAAKLAATRGYDRTGGYYGRFSGPGAELKFFDTALNFNFDATAEAASTAATGQLDLIPQGVTESTRIGRKACIKSIQVEATVLLTSAASAASAVDCRLMLVQDTQANGAQASFADVYNGTAAPTALRNIANSERFKVLKDWRWQMNPGAGATTAYNSVVDHIAYYTKCDIPLEFSSTTGAITELKSNHVFLCYGAGGVGNDDTVQLVGNVRCRFSDN